MSRQIVFDRKKGLIGRKRSAYNQEEKEFGCNYVVDILDPVSFEKISTVSAVGGSDYDWHWLPNDDPRVQFCELFDIIEGGDADWYYSGSHDGDGIAVEEALIENKHNVFEMVRKVFAPEREAMTRKIAKLEELVRIHTKEE